MDLKAELCSLETLLVCCLPYLPKLDAGRYEPGPGVSSPMYSMRISRLELAKNPAGLRVVDAFFLPGEPEPGEAGGDVDCPGGLTPVGLGMPTNEAPAQRCGRAAAGAALSEDTTTTKNTFSDLCVLRFFVLVKYMYVMMPSMHAALIDSAWG